MAPAASRRPTASATPLSVWFVGICLVLQVIGFAEAWLGSALSNSVAVMTDALCGAVGVLASLNALVIEVLKHSAVNKHRPDSVQILDLCGMVISYALLCGVCVYCLSNALTDLKWLEAEERRLRESAESGGGSGGATVGSTNLLERGGSSFGFSAGVGFVAAGSSSLASSLGELVVGPPPARMLRRAFVVGADGADVVVQDVARPGRGDHGGHHRKPSERAVVRSEPFRDEESREKHELLFGRIYGVPLGDEHDVARRHGFHGRRGGTEAHDPSPPWSPPSPSSWEEDHDDEDISEEPWLPFSRAQHMRTPRTRDQSLLQKFFRQIFAASSSAAEADEHPKIHDLGITILYALYSILNDVIMIGLFFLWRVELLSSSAEAEADGNKSKGLRSEPVNGSESGDDLLRAAFFSQV